MPKTPYITRNNAPKIIRMARTYLLKGRKFERKAEIAEANEIALDKYYAHERNFYACLAYQHYSIARDMFLAMCFSEQRLIGMRMKRQYPDEPMYTAVVERAERQLQRLLLSTPQEIAETEAYLQNTRK